MARNRIVKVEFWSDAKVGKLSPIARLLYIGMWNFADDYGTVPANCKKFNADIFEYDDFSGKDIENMLTEIESQGMIKRFSAEDKDFYYIVHFLDHQKISKKSERTYPMPPESVLQECSENVTVTLQKHPRNVPNSNENSNENGNNNDNGERADEPPSLDFSFEEFKSKYPKGKDGNQPGMSRAKLIYSQSVNGNASRIFKALENYAKTGKVKQGYVFGADKFLLTEWQDYETVENGETTTAKYDYS